MPYQAPRGTHDILPAESHAWRWMEAHFAQNAALYGYEEIRTPAFEDTELFARTSGETSDIVTKQMYQLRDKGDRDLTLKPEGTAPAIRAYLEHKLAQPGQTSRLWYFTPIFRYERPQKGRFRQSHQFGLELIGSASPKADAEVIEATVRFYERMGIKGLNVLLNSIGRQTTRAAYREALLKFAQPHIAAMEPEAAERMQRNPLRLLDSKDPELAAAMSSAPKVLDYLEPESAEAFVTLQSLLKDSGIQFTLAPEIVRGLDYYTDTVFEVHSTQLGAQSALCGGGRYDNLIAAIGGPPTPSVGVGIGVERAHMVLEAEGLLPERPAVKAFLCAARPEHELRIQEIARMLRAGGVSCQYDFEGRSLKSQFKAADRSGAEFAIVVGDDEAESGTLTLRNLRTHEQHSKTPEAALEALRA